MEHDHQTHQGMMEHNHQTHQGMMEHNHRTNQGMMEHNHRTNQGMNRSNNFEDIHGDDFAPHFSIMTFAALAIIINSIVFFVGIYFHYYNYIPQKYLLPRRYLFSLLPLYTSQIYRINGFRKKNSE